MLSVVVLCGCPRSDDGAATPRTRPAWDQSHLLDADPGKLTDADLAATAASLTDHYWRLCQVRGVLWQPRRSDPGLAVPDGYGGGADSALFTGFALAAFALEADATGDARARERAVETLRGLYYLTHVAGAGVIARCAFPADEVDRWNYAAWQSRIERGFVHTSPARPAPWGGELPASIYYTRATRDQVTGMLTGLSVAWALLEDTRPLIAGIMEDLRRHLVRHKWRIRDERGKNDTSADHVTGLLRVQFDALYRHTVKLSRPDAAAAAQREYVGSFQVASPADAVNVTSNLHQYYAHSLRAARAFSIWMLEEDAARRAEAAAFVTEAVWRHTQDHENAWLAAVTAAMDPANAKAKRVLRRSLASLSLKPVRQWGSPLAGRRLKWGVVAPHLRKPANYFTWMKLPGDVGESPNKEGLQDRNGVDFLLPYWMGRRFGSGLAAPQR